MITNINTKISIVAYFLSKFDRDAVRALGYATFTDAFEGTSARFGKTNNYLKLRRDEFDVLTGSSRKGWHRRAPSRSVLLLHDDLKNFNFEELKDIVSKLLEDSDEPFVIPKIVEADKKLISEFSEHDFEILINMQDPTAEIVRRKVAVNTRIFNNQIQRSLKSLYKYRCQVCGATAIEHYEVDVSEAHHIEPFIRSMNNSPNNILILCPDHHRIVHKTHAVFNAELRQFEYANTRTDRLMYNLHL